MQHRQSTRTGRPSRVSILRAAGKCRLRETDSFAIGRNAHNVYHEDDCWYVCDSSGHALRRRYDKPSPVVGSQTAKIIGDSVDLGDFTRGLARFPGGFVVGLSADTPRSKRADGDASLVLLDDDLRIVDKLPLPTYGGVHDVRVLNVPDRAHHGIPMEISRC